MTGRFHLPDSATVVTLTTSQPQISLHQGDDDSYSCYRCQSRPLFGVENHVPADPDDDWRRVRFDKFRSPGVLARYWANTGSLVVCGTDNQALLTGGSLLFSRSR
jgi:hypothetical protein